MPVTSGTLFPSWPVMLLPNMERNDIFKAWTASAQPSPYVQFFVCPSSPPDTLTQPTLAYAGNVGAGSNAATQRGSGVMLDTTITSGATAGRITFNEIAGEDGTATTLLLSERCGPAPALVQTSWNVRPTTFSFSNSATAIPAFGVAGAAPAKTINNTAAAGPPGFSSQPSSNHPGGAVVAFSDGHTGFLKDSLQAKVYAQLLSWKHSSATAGPYSTWSSDYPVLAEGDYQ